MRACLPIAEASRVVRKSPSVCTRGLGSLTSEHRRLFLVFGCWKTFGEASCTRRRAERNAQGRAGPQFLDRRHPQTFCSSSHLVASVCNLLLIFSSCVRDAGSQTQVRCEGGGARSMSCDIFMDGCWSACSFVWRNVDPNTFSHAGLPRGALFCFFCCESFLARWGGSLTRVLTAGQARACSCCWMHCTYVACFFLWGTNKKVSSNNPAPLNYSAKHHCCREGQLESNILVLLAANTVQVKKISKINPLLLFPTF